jgi:hypothetical protein
MGATHEAFSEIVKHLVLGGKGVGDSSGLGAKDPFKIQ